MSQHEAHVWADAIRALAGVSSTEVIAFGFMPPGMEGQKHYAVRVSGEHPNHLYTSATCLAYVAQAKE